MKCLVMSDSHGHKTHFEKIKQLLKEVDCLIHLGDYDSDALALNTDKPTYTVRGNCDYESANPLELLIDLAGVKCLLVHGHSYAVKQDLNRLYYRASELSVQVVFFGHTHIPLQIEHQDITIINPGSVAIPKGGSKAQCLVVSLNNEGIEVERVLL